MGSIALEKMGEADMSAMPCVERGLDVLADEGQEKVLRYLETSGLGRDEIPLGMRTVDTGLRHIFGCGSSHIEPEVESGLRLLEHLSPRLGGLPGAIGDLREMEIGTR
jgi:hypothetical protein